MRERAHNQKKGFTLIEVLVVLAIVGVLVPVIGGSIVQVIRGTELNNTMVIALADIEHAASFINQDLNMAQTTNLVYGQTADLVAGDNVTLNWTDYYDGQATWHEVQYYVSDTKLKRDYDGQVTNIALYISKAEFSIDGSGELVTFTLTSSPESVSERSETRTYRVYPRSEGG